MKQHSDVEGGVAGEVDDGILLEVRVGRKDVVEECRVSGEDAPMSSEGVGAGYDGHVGKAHGLAHALHHVLDVKQHGRRWMKWRWLRLNRSKGRVLDHALLMLMVPVTRCCHIIHPRVIMTRHTIVIVPRVKRSVVVILTTLISVTTVPRWSSCKVVTRIAGTSTTVTIVVVIVMGL